MTIPADVRRYLAAGDSLARAQVTSDHPDVGDRLADPRTRESVLAWLRSDEATQPEASHLVAGCLTFLRPAAEPAEVSAVRPFTLHPDAVIRLRAFEFLLTLYFPDRNREALLMVLQAMLADAADPVRTLGMRYVERADAAGELDTYLRGWVREAPAKGWHTGEAAELAPRLLGDDPDREG